MSRVRTRLLWIALLAVLLVAGGFGFFTYQVQQVPQFYRQAIAASPREQVQAGEQFETEALELQNQIQRTGDWQVELAADEINGWLATVLPEKFGEAIPPGISDPRVAIEQGRLLAACKYQAVGIETVVSIELEAFLTNETNVVAVRVHQVAAGKVPIPLGQYLEQITAAAAERGIFVRWQEVDGDPLALISLPLAEPDDKRSIVIRSLELSPGKLIATGTAEDTAPVKRPRPVPPHDSPGNDNSQN
ncbi:hypothetical protein ETAA8_49290 [Anatilimnocola aggregata]|uniref:Uncharacterized protein n=1 Tax=Anatilimnocola aggregata TaxID=2528021 RepID=A0A517YHX9_9BACT|nr:hypothetical protein [Anatilimnocola aggregata]QDU29814.1 hypothetical protein ETAA8_49290 [Anatilimnocola aggregata]